MTFKREPIQIVEIDLDFCLNTFGVSPCTASLNATTTPFKCFNGYKHCADKPNYNKGTLTLRFVPQYSDLPKDGNVYFPVLKSVRYSNETVNIGTGDDKLGSLGKRGNADIVIDDFFHHFRGFDKYADERRSGVAQFDGEPIDPSTSLTFWNALKLRHPNYADSPFRVINTFIETDANGVRSFSDTDSFTRHYIIGSIKGPGDRSSVTIKAKDILSLSDKKTAIAPKVSEGALVADITDSATSLSLKPVGVGDAKYPTSGFATVGEEIVSYTRVADVVTLTERGLGGSVVGSHSEGDTFQQTIRYEGVLVNEVIDDLLTNYTTTPAEWIVSDEYEAEAIRWGSTMKIFTYITEPTPVIELLGQLTSIGVALWSESTEKKIKMRLNHARDYTETVTNVTDDNSIKSISVDDRDEDRITQVHYWSVQKDATEDVKDKSNYNRAAVVVDTEAQNDNFFGETRIKEVLSRWFNRGNDTAIRIMARRLLQRFRKAPVTYTITADWNIANRKLVDLLRIRTIKAPDVQGRIPEKIVQIIGRDESKFGHEVVLTCQDFEFEESLSFIMPNDTPTYDLATEEQKEIGCFIVAEADAQLPDGRQRYGIM